MEKTIAFKLKKHHMRKEIVLLFLYLTSIIVYTSAQVNILNIVVDDMGYSDLGCFGGEIQTPNINQLAQNGIRFSNYKTYPKCFPTRNAMLSGIQSTPFLDGSATVAELLKASNPDTKCYFVGKTHGDLLPNFEAIHKRSFDRSFGNEDGGNYFDHTLKQCLLDNKPWHTDKPFYKTDVQADFAIKFLKEHDKKKPFFMHLAFHAPHFPVQAKPEDIKKYEKIYLQQPQEIRKKRFKRLIESGILTEKYLLSDQEDQKSGSWKKLKEEDRKKFAKAMATHAAMIDCIDQNIGRIIATLKSLGVFENTFITLVSDNGATNEGGKGLWPGHKGSRFGRDYDNTAPIGSENSHWQIGTVWANLCNTPFRKFKNTCYEGGLSSPLIIHYPKKIKKPSINHQTVYVWDFVPTWLALTSAKYPQKIKDKNIKPLMGHSILPTVFKGAPFHQEQDREALFFYKRTKATAYIKGCLLYTSPSPRDA